MVSQWQKLAGEVLTGRARQEANKKTAYGLLAELKSCSISRDLEWGRRLHAKVLETGLYSSAHVATALLNMYAKCGSMVDARQVFGSIKNPSVVSWTALIFGYAENGEGHVALDLFFKMKSQACAPNSVTYVAALKACGCLALKQGKGVCLERGKQIHSEIIGCHLDLRVQNTLIDMYAKCGSMVDAHQVFNNIEQPSLVSWNALLAGYAENGEGLIALDLFSWMKAQGCIPDSITYVAALKACVSFASKQDGSGRADCLERGKQIHSEIGQYSTLSVQTTLVDMYAKCGSMVDAHHVFKCIRRPDTVSWTALLSGYADHGDGLITLDLFARMKAQGCAPDSRAYGAALKACACLAAKQDRSGCLERGRQIHAEIGCHLDNYVQNALIDMYAKCGSMSDAHLVFSSIRCPDVVAWNALILGYAENGEGLIALDLFWGMKSQGYAPDCITYVAALKACASLAVNDSVEGLKWAKQLHLEIGCHSSLYVATTLIVVYAKCGSMSNAHQVFTSLEQPSVVSWNALLLGYADSGDALPVLHLFLRMKSRGCSPDSITYVAVFKACGILGALEFGRKVHAEIGEPDDVNLVTCLVDFYAKCGSLVEAQDVFYLHPGTRDLTTWTALLAGYSSFGETASVLGLFEAMQDAGFQPDGVTMQCILMCCSHGGLVREATECFHAMSAKYGVTPNVEHYTCILDVLSRANRLDDSLVLLGSMPCSPNATTWMAVLGACCKWKNVDIGLLAFQCSVSLNERNASAYVLMAHIFASRGMWEEQAIVLGMRKTWDEPP